MAPKKVIIVTQARIGSTRFPEKVLQPLGEKNMLFLHLKRLQNSNLAKEIIVATTLEEKVDQIISTAKELGISVFQGSTHDVLDRFYNGVKSRNPDLVVRVTSDCPLLDAQLIDDVICMVLEKNLDYGSNILREEFPDGQDVEVFSFEALEIAWKMAKTPSDREHVTPFIRRNSSYMGGKMFRSDNFGAQGDYNSVRMTVDEPADLHVLQQIIEVLGEDKSWKEYSDYILNHYEELSNQKIKRNEGYLRSLTRDKNE